MGRAFPLGDSRQEWEVVEVGRLHGTTKVYMTQWPVLHILAEVESGVFLGDLLTPPSRTMARVVVHHGEPIAAVLFEDVGLKFTAYLHIIVRKKGFKVPPGIVEAMVLAKPYPEIQTYRASVHWKSRGVLRMAHHLGFRAMPHQTLAEYVDLEVPFDEFRAAVLGRGSWYPRYVRRRESPPGSEALVVAPSHGGSR